MSYINVTNIQVLNNPNTFMSPLTFQVTFECLKEIPEEIEWKLLYIGSSKDVKYDQILDCVSMGPLDYGVMQFDLESSPPDSTKIPQTEILGVTAIILSVSFRNQEFFRVGYYVYNFYADQELADNPPDEVQIDKITRNILADKPRITRFDIRWGDEKDGEFVQNNEGLAAQEAGLGYLEKMHLFMNDGGDLSESVAGLSNSQNPFLTVNEHTEPYSKSLNQAHNSGYELFAGGNNENYEGTANQANPFA